MKARVAATALMLCAACTKEATAPTTRVTLRRTSGATFELVPSAGQPPFCLAFTVSRNGLTRQLTMSSSNTSFNCPAGQPVDARGYKVPLADGPVKVYTLFTSAAVNAASIAQQILEAPDRQHLSAMNLRLPGNAVLDVSEFTPEVDQPAQEGRVLSETAAPDAGSAP